jgi:hypothetical protein
MLAVAQALTIDAIRRVWPHAKQRLYVLLDEFLNVDRNERMEAGIGGMLAAHDLADDQTLAGGGRHLDESGPTIGAPMRLDRLDCRGLLQT